MVGSDGIPENQVIPVDDNLNLLVEETEINRQDLDRESADSDVNEIGNGIEGTTKHLLPDNYEGKPLELLHEHA